MNNLAVIEIPEEETLSVFTADKGLDPYLEQIKEETESLVPDLSSKKGRDAIASMAYKVSRAKTALDNIGKDLVAELKKQPALVDASRKQAREYLDDLRDSVRQPLTDWEAEQERIKAEEAAKAEAEKLRAQIESEHEIALLMYEKVLFEREQEAKRIEEERIAKEEELKLKAANEARIKAEQQAAAEKTRIEKEKADAVAAAEESDRQRIAAEERAKLQAEQAEQRAKQAAIDAENRVKREAEAKAQAEAAALAKREADVLHRKTINNEAADCFVKNGFSLSQAKQIVTLIAQKKVANVAINY